ncbi:E3 SUMO-protein ligase ZBED1-like isoform X1 [Anopheles arabiensis]|uniref:E3 SUMO-protein ligase ZBED1-like isoform X1 n=1 Tax=Anopheles arabiensis TaxID=7173 RepID=UPI001AAC8482|nr:E3 SUMO-protein ligase ZBED1-like isoform X1 [Anopheles arabiensis]
MENSQTKRSTRSAAPPAVSAEMPELKEEPIDDDISLDHTRQAATETTHQEGFLSSGARDPFLDEMEIGETSITFPNAFLDAFGQDVKTEQPTAEESDLNAEAVEAAGSSTAKRKNCDDEESEEDSSSATKRLPNSTHRKQYLKQVTWMHFEQTAGGGICRYCGKMIKMNRGSTWNLARHMRSFHAGIKFPIATGEDATSPRSPTPTNVSVVTSDQNGQTSHADFAGPLSTFNSNNLDRLLMLALIKDCNPFTMIEGNYFRVFVSKLNQQYKMPSTKYLTNELLPRVYNETVESVLFKLNKAETISLTIEGWTNSNNTNLKAITAHFLQEGCKPTSHLLECLAFKESTADEDIVEWIKKVINKFALRGKVVSLTSNHVSDMKSACLKLGLQHYYCFAHGLDTVVQNAITDSIMQTYEKVKQIILDIRQSDVATKTLLEMQDSLNLKDTKLKCYNANDWNSTYDMLYRFWQNKIPVLVCMNSLQVVTTNMQPNDWSTVEHSVQVLGYFDEAVKHVSSDSLVTLSKMGLIVRLLQQKVIEFQRDTKSLKPDMQDMVSRLISGIAAGLEPLKNDQHVLQAMILDPRIKQQGLDREKENFQSASEAIIKAISPMYMYYELPSPKVQQQSSVPTNSIFFSFVSSLPQAEALNSPKAAAKAELDRYLKADILALDQDPLMWWHKEKNNYPKLYDLVQKRFCIAATAVPCDRMYTKAGRLYREKRCKLGVKNVHEFLFIQQNYDNAKLEDL